jgi:hypothetical protein
VLEYPKWTEQSEQYNFILINQRVQTEQYDRTNGFNTEQYARVNTYGFAIDKRQKYF